MADIVQKLGFDASKALRSIGNLNKRLKEGTEALKKYKRAADSVGAGGASAAGLNKTQKSVDDTKSKVNSLTVSWKTMVRVIQTQIALRSFNMLLSNLKEATENARQLGLALAEVQTIGQGMNIGTGQLTAGILALSDAMGKAPTDLAEGLYQTLSNQVVAAGDAFEFNAQAARLATIAASDQKSAINALSSVLNSYGKSAGEAEYISGTLFKTVEYGRLRLDEIGDILGRVLPLSSQLGVSWEEVAAAVATMTRQGVKADTALTQLRAIFQQLIRPGHELQSLMKDDWGVPNAEAAFKAFGGFPGVMKKIAEETNGSTEEVGELFRRVRAVAGYFGTMTDDGNELTKTLANIKDEAGDAAEVFNQFTQTDAFKMTQQMQIFENQWTRLGMTVMPLVNRLIFVANEHMRNLATTWKVLTGQMNDSVRLANLYKTAQEVIKQKVKEVNEEYQKNPPGKQYEEAMAAANRYYAELNKQEATLRRVRDTSIDSANAKMQSANERIINVFKNGAKELKKFLDDAAKLAKDTAGEIADAQRDIDDRTLDYRLDNAKSNAQKLKIIDEQLGAARAKIFDAFNSITADPESKQAAKDAIAAAVRLADEGARLATDQQTRNKYARQAIGFRENEKNAVRAYKNEVQAVTDLANEQYGQITEGEKQATALLKARFDLQKELIAEGTKEDRKKTIVEEIAAIDQELRGVFEKANISDALIKSLNLDTVYAQMSVELSSALDAAHKDWAAEVERMKAAFAAEVIPITVAIEKVAGVTDAGEALGLSIRPGETQGEFAGRVQDEALATIEAQGEQQRKLAEAEAKYGTQAKANQLAINELTKNHNRELQEALSKRVTYAKYHDETLTTEQAYAQERARMARNMETEANSFYKRLQTTAKLKAEMEEIVRATAEGKQLEDKVYQTMNKRLAQATEAGNIRRELAEGLATMLPELRRQNRDRATAQEDIQPVDEERVAVAEAYLKTVKDGVAELEKQKAPAEQLKDAMVQAKPPAQELATSSGETANNTGTAAGAMTSVGQNASASVAGVNALTSAAAKLAAQAERAATAQAAASSGGGGTASSGIESHPGYKTNPFYSQYMGGRPKYFAMGGRGQDRVPAMLARGEMVVSRRNSQRFFSELNAMNQGSRPVYREQGGTVTNVGDINVTVNGGDSSQQTVREIGRALRRDVQRGNIKLR